MRVIHFIDSLSDDKGGPSRSVSNQCLYTSKAGVEVDLAWSNTDIKLADEAINLPKNGVKLIPIDGYFPFIRIFKEVKKHDLIHINGIWRPFTAIAALSAKILKKPFVITPHGMLEPWSLNQKWFKKKLALLIYEKYLLDSTVFLQATATEEGKHFKLIGLKSPVAVIPNGVVWPEKIKPVKVPGNKRRLLFLSRIHPKKGVIELLRAINKNRFDFIDNGWVLTITGPDEGGHLKLCKDEAQKLDILDLVEWMEPVSGSKKWALLRSAQAFVLPTYSENFGIVIAEALAASVPVLTTQGTPWHELEEMKCGWWVPVGQESLNASLKTVILTKTSLLKAMGQRGKALVHRKYGWKNIGIMLAESYRWALGQEIKPSFVEVSDVKK